MIIANADKSALHRAKRENIVARKTVNYSSIIYCTNDLRNRTKRSSYAASCN